MTPAPHGGEDPGAATGVHLAVDVGTVRIGVARSDGGALLAVPLETIDRSRGDAAALARLASLVAEYDAVAVLVGDPVGLSGGAGAAAQRAREFAAALAAALAVADRPVPVRLVDERMSTVQAQRDLHAAGRSTRTSRAVIDQAAAVVFLQSALDRQRGTGRPVGVPVEAQV